MSSTFAWTVSFAAVTLCLSTPLRSRGAPQDPLWRQAVAVASTNNHWVAGLVVTRSEVMLKGEGGVHELWQRSTLGDKGGVVTRTVKVLENGKDVTEQQKSKATEKRDTKTKKTSSGGNPFDAKVQEQITVKATGISKVIAATNCVGYEFDLRSTNGPRMRGVAWLEKEKGWPVEIENMTLDPLPEKHLKQMVITTRYEMTPAGAWTVKEMITTGTVSMFFIKADTRSVTTFSEYWKRPRTLRKSTE